MASCHLSSKTAALNLTILASSCGNRRVMEPTLTLPTLVFLTRWIHTHWGFLMTLLGNTFLLSELSLLLGPILPLSRSYSRVVRIGEVMHTIFGARFSLQNF